MPKDGFALGAISLFIILLFLIAGPSIWRTIPDLIHYQLVGVPLIFMLQAVGYSRVLGHVHGLWLMTSAIYIYFAGLPLAVMQHCIVQ